MFNVILAATAVVLSGNARFTVLTDRLIRMEYAPDGRFEDRPTLTFVNRNLPVPSFSTNRLTGASDEGVAIDTGRVRLTYLGGKFSSGTLFTDFWHYGDEDKGNLHGTKRTLDAVHDRKSLMEGNGDNDWGRGGMEHGLMSRDGWTVVDDAQTPVFVPTASGWDQWVAPRNAAAGYEDLYLFAYGHDYKACLADYVKVAGKIPLPPKWAFGYWWSRYWLYSDREIRELVERQRQIGVPLDVFILDMEWHETWNIGFSGTDEFGQLNGWTGYTWNRRLFPNPKGLISWLHANGIRTAANLHPASGIQPMEDCYAAFCRDYGWSSTNAVPYRMSEEKWADCYFKDVLEPIEAQGMDFWWLDWQQWANSKYVPGLSNTFWLNYVFNHHAERRDGGRGRPMIYHRWGGLGSHRYQVGFSGDTIVSWNTLEVLPWFTATAANVGYGYWGHDIGGHCSPKDGLGTDPDLFLRWLQSGVFTPIFKTHSTKDADIERRIWMYPDQLFAMREAIRLRYRLVPYIYTAARQAYDSGVSVCRPMYYDWPEDEKAYDQNLHQLMFGDDILAGTVVRPMDKNTRLSKCTVWFPDGKWFDVESGTVIDGGGVRELERSETENPWFVRAGTVIPMYTDDVMSIQLADESKMALFVVPGVEHGEGELYEDGATNPDYENVFARTRFAFDMSGDGLKLRIGGRTGSYAGMPRERKWEIRLPNRWPPKEVRVGGKKTGWRYVGADLMLVIDTPMLDPAKETVVEIDWDSIAGEERLNGKRGFLRRCVEIGEVLKPAYNALHWAANVPNSYLDFAQFASMVDADSQRMCELLDCFDEALEKYKREFRGVERKLGEKVSKLVRAQLGF